MQVAERQRIQALEAQQEGLLKWVQQIGQQQGWQIPENLLAPPRLTHHVDSTTVSTNTNMLLSMLMLSVKLSDGGFVDVWAFCWICSYVGLRAGNVFVSLRADVFVVGFGNLPVLGRCC